MYTLYSWLSQFTGPPFRLQQSQEALPDLAVDAGNEAIEAVVRRGLVQRNMVPTWEKWAWLNLGLTT